MKKKGFTLIELLVVVAIIGILAAVGVVAYNGYTKAAKIDATKANHKTVANFIKVNFAKCEIGEELILKQNEFLNEYMSNQGNATKNIVLHINNLL